VEKVKQTLMSEASARLRGAQRKREGRRDSGSSSEEEKLASGMAGAAAASASDGKASEV